MNCSLCRSAKVEQQLTDADVAEIVEVPSIPATNIVMEKEDTMRRVNILDLERNEGEIITARLPAWRGGQAGKKLVDPAQVEQQKAAAATRPVGMTPPSFRHFVKAYVPSEPVRPMRVQPPTDPKLMSEQLEAGRTGKVTLSQVFSSLPVMSSDMQSMARTRLPNRSHPLYGVVPMAGSSSAAVGPYASTPLRTTTEPSSIDALLSPELYYITGDTPVSQNQKKQDVMIEKNASQKLQVHKKKKKKKETAEEEEKVLPWSAKSGEAIPPKEILRLAKKEEDPVLALKALQSRLANTIDQVRNLSQPSSRKASKSSPEEVGDGAKASETEEGLPVVKAQLDTIWDKVEREAQNMQENTSNKGVTVQAVQAARQIAKDKRQNQVKWHQKRRKALGALEANAGSAANAWH